MIKKAVLRIFLAALLVFNNVPCYAAYALLTSVEGWSQVNGTTFTTSAIDTTTSDILIVMSVYYLTAPTLTDSAGNTWTALTTYSSSLNYKILFYYCQSPTTSTSHTFTFTGTSYAYVVVSGFSGSTTSPADQDNGFGTGAGTTTSIQPGSITPSVDNTLVVTGLEIGVTTGSISVDSPYTIIQSELAGNFTTAPTWHFGGGMAYSVQATATATNPTWTYSSIAGAAANIASFKPSTGGGGGSVSACAPPFCGIIGE